MAAKGASIEPIVGLVLQQTRSSCYKKAVLWIRNKSGSDTDPEPVKSVADPDSVGS
jgi:hypothetical protein